MLLKLDRNRAGLLPASALQAENTDAPEAGGYPAYNTAGDTLEEVRLMQAAREDPQLFAPLYERYFSRIYRYCLRRVDNPQEAEDLTSQIFVRALKGLDNYRGGVVAAWLFRIAHNAVANHLRGRHPQVSIDHVPIEFATDDPDPIKQVIQAEQEALLHEMIAGLPDYQQDLLAMKFAARLSSQEMGAALGKSAGAIRVDLYRIVNRLRMLFRQAVGEDSEL